ncbi:MAG: VirB3 family type IV secretion system protein [Acidobacteriota bacterium]
MTEPITRTTFKAITKPLHTKGVTRPIAMVAVALGLFCHQVIHLWAPLWVSVPAGFVIGLSVYFSAREMLKIDPHFFTIWWRARQRPRHFDAAKRDALEVWIV